MIGDAAAFRLRLPADMHGASKKLANKASFIVIQKVSWDERCSEFVIRESGKSCRLADGLDGCVPLPAPVFDGLWVE